MLKKILLLSLLLEDPRVPFNVSTFGSLSVDEVCSLSISVRTEWLLVVCITSGDWKLF